MLVEKATGVDLGISNQVAEPDLIGAKLGGVNKLKVTPPTKLTDAKSPQKSDGLGGKSTASLPSGKTNSKVGDNGVSSSSTNTSTGQNLTSDKGITGPPSNKTGFMGRAGFELKNSKIQPIRNKTQIIDGMDFSGHALDQMQNRGITPSIVKHILNNGEVVKSSPGIKIMYDKVNRLQVVTNSQTNKIITVKRVGIQ